MASLKEAYQSFLADIEKNMKNKEDLDYVKARFAVFLNVVVDQMDMIINFKEDKMKELEEAQKNLVNKLDKMQQVIDNIEKEYKLNTDSSKELKSERNKILKEQAEELEEGESLYYVS